MEAAAVIPVLIIVFLIFLRWGTNEKGEDDAYQKDKLTNYMR